ncbi:MAG: primosomal replication protein N [Gammaproteobacteria bacterium]
MSLPQSVGDNVLVIGGYVAKAPQTRVSPAGIPITRFLLDHGSQQVEAGLSREVRCRIAVVASGADLQNIAGGLSRGRAVRVTGFMARSGYRDSELRIVLHAQRIEYLD